ncbi:MAG: hypothetical protein PHS35_04630 [Dehalococcoidales bacterium]|nr:hypothetical protein [Dehalococcoidales bacterium]
MPLNEVFLTDSSKINRISQKQNYGSDIHLSRDAIATVILSAFTGYSFQRKLNVLLLEL